MCSSLSWTVLHECSLALPAFLYSPRRWPSYSITSCDSLSHRPPCSQQKADSLPSASLSRGLSPTTLADTGTHIPAVSTRESRSLHCLKHTSCNTIRVYRLKMAASMTTFASCDYTNTVHSLYIIDNHYVSGTRVMHCDTCVTTLYCIHITQMHQLIHMNTPACQRVCVFMCISYSVSWSKFIAAYQLLVRWLEWLCSLWQLSSCSDYLSSARQLQCKIMFQSSH